MKCSGALIGDRFVLTAAHCLEHEGNNPLGFALAQKAEHVSQRPFGTHGVRRAFIPTKYSDGGPLKQVKAYDYGIVEIWQPIEGATPAHWGYVPLSNLRKSIFTQGYPEDPPDNGIFGRPWITKGHYYTNQPDEDQGEGGLLYSSLDGSGGQSGSPVHALLTPSQDDGGLNVRQVHGVLIGSPVSACMQGEHWVTRLTPRTVEHIQNVMDPSTIDFFWKTINFPHSRTSGPGEPWP